MGNGLKLHLPIPRLSSRQDVLLLLWLQLEGFSVTSPAEQSVLSETGSAEERTLVKSTGLTAAAAVAVMSVKLTMSTHITHPFLASFVT